MTLMGMTKSLGTGPVFWLRPKLQGEMLHALSGVPLASKIRPDGVGAGADAAPSVAMPIYMVAPVAVAAPKTPRPPAGPQQVGAARSRLTPFPGTGDAL